MQNDAPIPTTTVPMHRTTATAPKNMARLVYVEGVIGVGKSTVLDRLQEQGEHIIAEDIRGWDLYCDYTFTFQVEACLTMHNRLKHAIEHCNGTIYCERSIMASVIFTNASPNMTPREKALIAKLAITLEQTLIVPKKTVYLECSPEIAIERIKARSGPGEQTIREQDIIKIDSVYRNLMCFDSIVNTCGQSPEQLAHTLKHPGH